MAGSKGFSTRTMPSGKKGVWQGNIYHGSMPEEEESEPLFSSEKAKSALDAFLKGFGMKISGNNTGGTKLKKHIMELPTNSSKRR
jgi:hypothetical protein